MHNHPWLTGMRRRWEEEYYTKKLCLWQTPHGKNTTLWNALAVFHIIVWKAVGATLCGHNITSYTHTKHTLGLLMGAHTSMRLCLSRQSSAGCNKTRERFLKQITATDLEVRNVDKQVPTLVRSNTQGHTPAALTRNHPVQQRSSPGAGGGACLSCWPRTMTSHSCWDRSSRLHQHPRT